MWHVPFTVVVIIVLSLTLLKQANRPPSKHKECRIYVYWLVFTTKDDLNVKDVAQIDATAITGALIFSRSLNPVEHI
ncbi:MAG: hypothetical protein WA323_21075 [Candidatus Nitrosopolaris sp.]